MRLISAAATARVKLIDSDHGSGELIGRPSGCAFRDSYPLPQGEKPPEDPSGYDAVVVVSPLRFANVLRLTAPHGPFRMGMNPFRQKKNIGRVEGGRCREVGERRADDHGHPIHHFRRPGLAELFEEENVESGAVLDRLVC